MSGIILKCVGALGLILSIMGVIAAFMFIFGIGKIKVGGKNKVQYKIKGAEVQIETGHVYFAIVLGLVLAITPFPISKHFGDIGKANAVDKATITTSGLEEGKYTISEDEIRVDLRNRKEIGISGYLGSELSETERLIRIVIKDVGSGVEKVNFRYATSVHSIAVIYKPKGAKWAKIEEKSEEVVYNPFTNILRGKEFFKDLLKRRGKMRSYYMIVPITDGRGQEFLYKLKYHNAFQGDNFEWASEIVSADTDKITMHITFPEDKPFKSFETSKKETPDPDAPRIQIDNPKIETPSGNHILTWNIEYAKKGEVYYIKWQW
jgi:hypothetical protein